MYTYFDYSHTLLQAFSSLAEAAYEAADVNEESDEPDTYCLSAAFAPIVQKLLGTTDRADGMLLPSIIRC